MFRPMHGFVFRAITLSLLVAGFASFSACSKKSGPSVPTTAVELTHGIPTEGVSPHVAAHEDAASDHDVASFFTYAGYPTGHEEAVEVLTYRGYAVGFSSETRTPLWAAYHLFLEDEPDPTRPKLDFAPDPRMDVTVTHDEYTNSGYDRGHMAPSSAIGIVYGKEAQAETFVTTNICPQLPGLNQRGWEALEGRITDGYLPGYEQVWVVAGPIFDDTCEELVSDIRIPSAFYMVMISEEEGTINPLAVIMPHRRVDREPLEDFVVTVDEVERRTGLDFFVPLDDATEDAIEADAAPDDGWRVQEPLDPTLPGRARQIRKRVCD